MKPNWTVADMPAQTGKVAIVTGANAGLGLYTALELARTGADVVLACRDMGRGLAAAEQIRQQVPAAKLTVEKLELASLASVRAFAERFAAAHQRLDILINNAATMLTPTRMLTEDGLELQMGVNHLGHFALAGRLAPQLREAGGRVVPLGSQSIMLRRPSLQDLQSEADYDPMGTYAKSKLACVLFARELSKRGQGVLGVAAHPGYSATTGQNVGPLFRLMTKLIAQPAERGVLPILYAATEHDVEGGAYYGPRGMNGMRGPPHRAALPPGADDDAAGARLWDDSERLTSVRW